MMMTTNTHSNTHVFSAGPHRIDDPRQGVRRGCGGHPIGHPDPAVSTMQIVLTNGTLSPPPVDFEVI